MIDKKTVILSLEVTYDPTMTDAEGLCTALDTLLETALSTPGIMEEYGNPEFDSFEISQEFS